VSRREKYASEEMKSTEEKIDLTLTTSESMVEGEEGARKPRTRATLLRWEGSKEGYNCRKGGNGIKEDPD